MSRACRRRPSLPCRPSITRSSTRSTGWSSNIPSRVTREPGRIPESVFQRLRAHFTDAQIVELTLRISLCGAYNRLTEALQIDNELAGHGDGLAAAE